MKKWQMILGIVMIVLLLTVVSCGPAATPVPTATEDTRGKTIMETKCSTCHGLAQIQTAKYDRASWEAVVVRMVAKGAQLNAEEQQLVIDYLAKTYPK